MNKEIKWASAILLLIIFLGLIIWSFSLYTQMEETPINEINIVARQFSYSPNNIIVEEGTKLIIHFTTEDVTHGFEIPELGVFNIQIPKGEVTTIEFIAETIGQFYYYCTVFCGTGHSDHIGTLTII